MVDGQILTCYLLGPLRGDLGDSSWAQPVIIFGLAPLTSTHWDSPWVRIAVILAFSPGGFFLSFNTHLGGSFHGVLLWLVGIITLMVPLIQCVGSHCSPFFSPLCLHGSSATASGLWAFYRTGIRHQFTCSLCAPGFSIFPGYSPHLAWSRWVVEGKSLFLPCWGELHNTHLLQDTLTTSLSSEPIVFSISYFFFF